MIVKDIISDYRYYASQKRLLDSSQENMLKIFDRKQCVFYHLPKTGGISVTKSLFGDIGWGHRDVKYYEKVFGKKKLRTFYKFTFVRNPYDRLVSAYFFLKKGGIAPQDKEFAEKYMNDYSSFEQFVKEGLRKREVIEWIHFKPQTDYLLDSKGNLAVDFVGKFENFQFDFQQVAERLEINASLKHLNKTGSGIKERENLYSPELKKIVYETYLRDFTTFKYDK